MTHGIAHKHPRNEISSPIKVGKRDVTIPAGDSPKVGRRITRPRKIKNTKMTEKTFMQLAIEEAKKAFDASEVPVGAVIVKNGEVIAKSGNANRAKFDPTSHAEIEAIRQACQLLESHRLDDCDIYVTLEPCAMCAAAISHARIRNLYFAAVDEKFGAVENGVRFFSSKSCIHKVDVYSGFCEEESKELLREFFKNKR